MRARSILPPLVTMLLGIPLLHAAPKPDPELGRVQWGRDLDAARAASRRDGRPILLLFDEVPGCATCVGFGQQVLTDPLTVEAIETAFVPVFIANCRPGPDAIVLARYGEPPWNNPVVRFLDADGRDVIPRADGLYSEHEILGRMREALVAARRPVPDYLTLALDESHRAAQREARFAMGCFWEGEARLGAIDGVMATRAIQLDGREAVNVTYDESRLPFERLVREADRNGCADRVWVGDDARAAIARRIVGPRAMRSNDPGRDAPDADQHHRLARSPLVTLDLTPLQATRINAALYAGVDPLRWLSPRQVEQAKRLGVTADAVPAAPSGAACKH